MRPRCLAVVWLALFCWCANEEVCGWGGVPGVDRHPYRVPLLRSNSNAAAALLPSSLSSSSSSSSASFSPSSSSSSNPQRRHVITVDEQPPWPHNLLQQSDSRRAAHILESRSRIVHESVTSSNEEPNQLPAERHLHVEGAGGRRWKSKEGGAGASKAEEHETGAREKVEHLKDESEDGYDGNNPAFELTHRHRYSKVHFRRRSANDDDDDEHQEEHVAPGISRNASNGNGGVTDGAGLSEMEIALIVVCAAVGFLACVVGFIILARYYWKRLHDDTLGYEGVLQRDNSESSMGTTRIADVKEANAKFEEMESGSPTHRKSSTALLNKHQSSENRPLEKVPLLPCANGTAVTERGSGGGDSPHPESDDVVLEVPVKKVEKVHKLERRISRVDAKSHAPMYSRLGLSQSDCSISSNTSANPTYKYGNQIEYMGGFYGYPCDETYNDNYVHVPPPPHQQHHMRVSQSPKASMVHISMTSSVDDDDVEVALQLVEDEDDGGGGVGNGRRAGANAAASANDDVFDGNEPASPAAFAEEADANNPNATDDSASSIFDQDTSDQSKQRHSANNSLVGLQEDLLDPCRLTEGNRAVSLPESFSPDNGAGAAVDLKLADRSDIVIRPEDSGWGDTDKGQFRGSLPVIHLNVAATDSPSPAAVTAASSSSSSYPVNEERHGGERA